MGAERSEEAPSPRQPLPQLPLLLALPPQRHRVLFRATVTFPLHYRWVALLFNSIALGLLALLSSAGCPVTLRALPFQDDIATQICSKNSCSPTSRKAGSGSCSCQQVRLC